MLEKSLIVKFLELWVDSCFENGCLTIGKSLRNGGFTIACVNLMVF